MSTQVIKTAVEQYASGHLDLAQTVAVLRPHMTGGSTLSSDPATRWLELSDVAPLAGEHVIGQIYGLVLDGVLSEDKAVDLETALRTAS